MLVRRNGRGLTHRAAVRGCSFAGEAWGPKEWSRPGYPTQPPGARVSGVDVVRVVQR